MAYRLGRRSVRTLSGVHPDLVRVVKRAIKLTTVDFTVLEGVRSKRRQRIHDGLQGVTLVADTRWTLDKGAVREFATQTGPVQRINFVVVCVLRAALRA